MLKKRNVNEFYENIAITHKIFETVVEKNKKLENKYYEENPALKVEFQKKERAKKLLPAITDPSEKYIINNIGNNGIKKIAINLFLDIHRFDFTKHSSVPKNREATLRDETTRYDLLSKINLYNHTMYCAISAIETCQKNDVPKSITDIVIILAILHDFGKHPEIFSKYKNKSDDLHNIVSSYYVKKNFRTYIGKDIHEDTYKQLIHTLYNHHKLPTSVTYGQKKSNEKERDSLLVNLLNQADYLAREKEQIFIEGQQV
jgi:hypothetical protein